MVGKGEVYLLFVLLEGSDIQLIPLSVECLLLDGRVPIEEITLVASRSHDTRFGSRSLYRYSLEHDSHRSISGQAEVSHITLDAVEHIVGDWHIHLGVTSHCEVLHL